MVVIAIAVFIKNKSFESPQSQDQQHDPKRQVSESKVSYLNDLGKSCKQKRHPLDDKPDLDPHKGKIGTSSIKDPTVNQQETTDTGYTGTTSDSLKKIDHNGYRQSCNKASVAAARKILPAHPAMDRNRISRAFVFSYFTHLPPVRSPGEDSSAEKAQKSSVNGTTKKSAKKKDHKGSA